MKKRNNVYSFFSNFTTHQLMDVISDIELLDNGYEIFYIVDTYDIMGYALPFTKNYTDQNSSKVASHRTIAYDAIFDKKNNLILLDEYKLELLSLKNQIQDNLKKFPKIKSKLIELIEKEDIDKENDAREITKIIKNNFDLIVALQIFIEYGDNIYQRFINLLTNNLTIFNFDTGDKEFDTIANKIFDNTRTSDLTISLYDKFVNEIKYRLLSLDNDLERFNYLENSYRDIAVIDRIIGITKKFNETYPTKKVAFHYLSSAPFKTSILFKLLKDFNIDINTNFNRNIFQCYLLKSFKNSNKTSNYKTDVLKLLQKVITERKFLEKSKEMVHLDSLHENNVFFKDLNILLTESEDDIRNSLILRSYEEHSHELHKALQQIKSEKQRNILSNFFNQTNHFLRDETSLLKKFDFATISIQEYRQIGLLSDKYINKNIRYEINIPIGKDIIRNFFQHLPILPFIEDKNTYTESINKICAIISQSPNSLIENNVFDQTIKDIISQLSHNSTINMKEMVIKFLIIGYINLITKAPKTLDLSTLEKYNNGENEIIDTLKAQKEIIKKSMIRPNTKEDMLEVKEHSGPFLKEIDYLLLWLFRRNHNCSKNKTDTYCKKCKYDEVIDFGKECINKYIKDGRFYHGLALAYHSKAYAKRLTCKNKSSRENYSKIINLFDHSYENLAKSTKYYENFIKNARDEATRILLVKSIIGTNNTMADCKLRKYTLSDKKDISILADINEHVSSIHENFKSISENINDYPTINHTIAELHYYEADFYFHTQDYQESYEKIKLATKEIYNFEQQKKYIPDYFFSIISDINKLRFSLFEKLNLL